MPYQVSRSTFQYIAGAITTAVGLLVLIGWQLDVAILKSPLADAVSMKANTAAAFLLAGLALIFLQRPHPATHLLVRVCALMIAIIGFISLCEYLFAWNAGIDEILFRESKDAVGTIHPGRMAPNTALNFLPLGFALFVFTFKRFQSSFLFEFPLVFSLIISILGFLGYITGLLELAGPAVYTKMAVNTAVTFIILCIGMIFTAYERQRSPITIEQKFLAGLTAAATVIIFISILSLSSIQSLLQASNWVKHTQQVKNQLDLVFSHVLEVQSNGRGFILTGDDEYLIAREKVSRELSTLMDNLRFQIADNPRQQKSFASLEKLVEERVAFSNRLVSTRRTKGEAEARLLFATNRGKMITDSIRVLVAQMLAEEDRILQMRQKTEEDHVSQTQLIIFASLALQGLLLAFIFVVVKRDVTGRKKAEESLRRLNKELDERVRERTGSLAKSEERYRSTLENLMEGCQIIDFDYRYLYINDVAANQGHRTKEKLLGRTMMEMYPGVENTQMFSELKRCMQERVPHRIENEFTYADGSKGWFHLSIEPVPEGLFILSLDITERKLTEENLQESEARYRAVLQSANDAIVTADRNGTIVGWNRGAERIFGYGYTEAVGQPMTCLMPESHRAGNVNGLNIPHSGGEPHVTNKTVELKGRRKDGSEFPMDLSLSEWETKQDRFYTSIMRDITGRKQAEEQILKANRIYAVISQINQMIVRIHSKDELFREACRIAIDIGQFQMAWIGLVDEQTKLVNPVVHYGVEDGYLSVIEEISISDVPEGRGPTGTAIREGRHFICNDIASDEVMCPWRDEALKRGYRSSIALPIKLSGKVIGAFSLYARVSHFFDQEEIVLLDEVTNDISFALEAIETEKRRNEAEEALRKSEEQFRLISENAADLIAVLDLEGRRVYNSPSYRNILGDPNELRDTDSFQEIHPYDRDKIRAIFQETVRTGIGQRAEYRFMKKDGTIFHIESQGSVIRDKDGNITNVVVVSRDVTEKKLIEQQFMRMQRMQSIGTLAGGVAHDLNNVLAPILLSVEILKKSISDERSQKMLQTLETSARRGSDIVGQILAFARGVEGERTLLQLRHIIEDTISIIKETFPKSISIRQEIPENIWPIFSDATQLNQMMMNLCVNARDAMPHGGTIRIVAENKIIDEQYAQMHIEAKPGNYLMISIEDTGTGMPPDVVNRIFEPFFTTKERGRGTGLGLSTVHTIVKNHNGFINVYSEVGKGTAFRVYLPAEMGETSTLKSQEQELLAGNGELILVVDDEASICAITKQTLETFGYRVATASDGTEALAIYASQGKDIALVLTDVMMPVMDGPRTIRALQKLNPAVKIIVSSGFGANGTSQENDKYAADVFLSKPYNAETLLKTVHSVLHS